MGFRRKGRILKVKTGYNPNSSSIGADLTPLLIIGSFFALIIPVVSFFVSYRLRNMLPVRPEDTDGSSG